MQNTTSSKLLLWVGRVLSFLAIAFLAFDGIIHAVKESHAVESSVQLGLNPNVLTPLGIVELACLVLYIIPQTSVLGAILMTGYLGGAVATHVRAGSDTFSLVFPFIIGALMWGGIFIRNARLRTLVPLLRA